MPDNALLHPHNYCVAFIDILGHRINLGTDKMIPDNELDKSKFIEGLFNALRPAVWMQQASENFVKEIELPKDNSLSKTKNEVRDNLIRHKVEKFNWSDGMVFYTKTDPNVDSGLFCPVNGISRIIALSGYLMLAGLAGKIPIRGGIDIGWGVINDGNFYGASVVAAYELESSRAHLPRIIIGNDLITHLNKLATYDGYDIYQTHSKDIAKDCFNMISVDSDGEYFIDYLSSFYVKTYMRDLDFPIHYKSAFDFINSEYSKYKKEKNHKLAVRYKILKDYFESNALD